ncbi:hypothetical protein M758_4G104500 [Ceratodon purpureus]|nr:hypothetical protein M758_4G104500 [Ceratodon purpureus]
MEACCVQASEPGLRGFAAWGRIHRPSCECTDGAFFVSKAQVPFALWRWLVMACVAAVLFSEASSVSAQGSNQGLILKSLARDWNATSLLTDWERTGTSDPCLGGWSGVTCDNATNMNVLTLNLTGKGLSGPIPAQISQLVYLEELDLNDNQIKDPIPPEIGKLVHLRRLSINNNSLTSLPPEALLTCNLTYLAMHRNRISGQLPVWISNMGSLEKLDMYANELWGGLPPEYGKLENMKSMQLWENQLSGFIPEEWRNMKNMNNYGLGHLYLTGPVPSWLFELPSLKIATLSRNQFVGSFPNITNLLHNGIANLSTLDLSCNFFQGDYPTLYYNTYPVPNTTIYYFSNCFANETDGSATLASTQNATQNTPTNCSRVWDCTSFYKQVLINLGGCAPCPSSQTVIDISRCVCGKVSSGRATSPVTAIVAGVIGGFFVMIIVIVLAIVYIKTRAPKYPQFGRKLEGVDDPWVIPKGLRRFHLQELEKATKNFSQKHYLGMGGFGKVYRGFLSDGKVVAIKCASLQSAQGQKEFQNELTLLGRLHHRNLVGLEGFCDDGGLQVLVYEYMENGDLYDNLFGIDGRASLNSYQRVEVVLGIARGLDYLHSFADPPVIHRDIKASNVLLDNCMVAKLADFGVSKISPYSHVSTSPIGTMGYVDPEYFRTNQVTVSSDIFSFGIVLLEIITGQPIIDPRRGEAINLQDWVQPRFKLGGIEEIIDPKIKEGYDEELYTKMTELAIRCSTSKRIERPTMKEVLNILEPLARASLEDLFIGSKRSSSQSMDKSLFEEKPETDSKHENHNFAIQANKNETGESSESSSDGSGDTKYFDSLVTARQVPR